MPSAARLFGAIFLAVVGYFAAQAFVPSLPENMPVGHLREVCAALGVITGWRVMGRLAGAGYGAAVSNGFRSAVTLVFFALLVFSIREMLLRSMDGRYRGPMHAITGTFELAYDYGVMLVTNGPAMGILFGGAILAAWVVEIISGVWK